jgi:predicted CopG family antitoxin
MRRLSDARRALSDVILRIYEVKTFTHILTGVTWERDIEAIRNTSPGRRRARRAPG